MFTKQRIESVELHTDVCTYMYTYVHINFSMGLQIVYISYCYFIDVSGFTEENINCYSAN